MADYQRIHVVSTSATDDELWRVRAGLGRGPVVLTAPAEEAARVVRALGAPPQVEVLLAPVPFPQVDRGHRVDALVRGHALHDRFRDVVVVTDPATATLLLRVLAPDQLPEAGAVTVVGLARGERPVAVSRAIISGLVLGGACGLARSPVFLLALPAVMTVVGLVLLVPSTWRHLGRELLLAAVVTFGVAIAVVAGSARFPAGF